MRTFLSSIRPHADRTSLVPRRAAAQDGFTLIEVIVSALMLALIVAGTFSGFEAADQSTAQDRLQDEAAVLAAQSQDQLRSAPASALEALATAAHTYTRQAAGVSFTIKQEARFVGGPEGSAGCSVTEHKSQVTNALRITSTVSWSHSDTNIKPVVETGVVTPPTGSALEVDVGNAPAPTEGVADVDVVVKYTPAGSSTVATLEGITPSAGCIVFGAIPATAATVEIPEQVGFVTPSGGQSIEPKEEVLAPNTTTYDPVTYQRGGAIAATFTYNGSTSYTHLNNKNESEKEEILGDTFVATSAAMTLPPKYEVGSTRGELIAATELYEPIPGSPVPSPGPYWYKPESTSPEATPYPHGNLFPFPESEGEGGWEVYAGDCASNDPETLKVPGVTVERKWLAPATTTEFKKVPLSRIALNVYKGTESEVAALGSAAVKNLESEHARLVTITNTKCTGTTPAHETEIKSKHTQDTTIGEARGGHLEFPFQPFGAYQLCVYNEETKKTYTVLGEDMTIAGTSQTIYLAQRSATERAELKTSEETKEKTAEATRKTEEAAAKSAREKTEAPAREKREKEEATEKSTREKQETAQKKWESEEATQKTTRETEEKTKSTRLAKEKEELTKWETEEKNEEKKGKHLKPTLAEKKKTQETSRKASEATEKTAEEKRKTEEAATASTKAKEESAKTTRKAEEAATASTKAKEEETKAAAVKKEEETWNARKAEEAKTLNARVKREEAEAKEGTNIVVESKKAECP
jgi:prepilin-type N-terminal cleavage/methylation domain-containing protein